jgi:hypothetical protein
MLLAKSNLRQQHYKAVGKEGPSLLANGCSLCQQPNGDVVGEADSVGTVRPRRGFANSVYFSTG